MATCAILTVSDTCFSKEKEDTSGKALVKVFKETFQNITVKHTDIVPDDKIQIISKLQQWVSEKINVVLTTGGTGLSPRDVTPEATRAVIDKEIPAVMHAMTAKSLQVTPMAMLSRAVCGFKEQTLIINFPGSKKGALECFSFVKDCIPHAISIICDIKPAITQDHNKIQGEISKVDLRNVADRPRQSAYPLLEVEEALDLIIRKSTINVVKEALPIEQALYRVLAEDVIASDDVPPFDASIKDGYAVLAADGAGPRKIRSFLAAGDSPQGKPLQSGEAIRIGTGAPVPPGADCIVQVEDTKLLSKSNGEEVEVNIDKAPRPGQDIRRSGSDLAKNTTVLLQGERLSAPHIGVLAALGKSRVVVYKPASVGIFTTGNELKEHFQELKPGQIRDSNRLALINLLKVYNYKCNDYGIIKDEPDSTKTAISTALKHNDVLITTGGVSMGEFDFVKRVLVEDFGATIHFGRVNIKPGKPTTFATLEINGAKKIVFGLPGNPVSACVTCLLFVVPMLRYLEGAKIWKFPTIPYVEQSKSDADPRPEYLRVVVQYVDGKLVATPNGTQVSSRLNSLVGANGLLLRVGSMTKEITLIGDLITQ